MATIGNLVAFLGLDSASFTRGMNKAQQNLASNSTRMNRALIKTERRFDRMSRNAGRGLRRLNGALLAIGAGFTLGAVIKQFSEFDTSMRRIVGLVGVAEKEVDGFRKAVLKLAPAVGKGPGELAEALFFVTSAGIRGKKAMEVLELSAKAASAGLGETKDVADALTSVLNAYKSAGLGAAEATNILVATVREGKLEASELSVAIGKILPIAEAAGVRFDELGASIAALTRIGLNSSEAITGVRSVLIALSKESSKGEKALNNLGSSFAELRASVRDKGLLQTLIDLKDLIGDNETAMQEIIGRAEGVTAVLALTGSQVEEVRGIFGRMVDTSGALDTAFDAVSKGLEFRLNAALTTVQASLVRLGATISPLVIKLADLVTKGINALTESLGGLDRRLTILQQRFAAFGLVDSPFGNELEETNFKIEETGRAIDDLFEKLGNLPQVSSPFAESFDLGEVELEGAKRIRAELEKRIDQERRLLSMLVARRDFLGAPDLKPREAPSPGRGPALRGAPPVVAEIESGGIVPRAKDVGLADKAAGRLERLIALKEEGIRRTEESLAATEAETEAAKRNLDQIFATIQTNEQRYQAEIAFIKQTRDALEDKGLLDAKAIDALERGEAAALKRLATSKKNNAINLERAAILDSVATQAERLAKFEADLNDAVKRQVITRTEANEVLRRHKILMGEVTLEMALQNVSMDLLDQAIDGNINSWKDLGRVALSILRDIVKQTLRSGDAFNSFGGGGGGGGIGSFVGPALSAVGSFLGFAHGGRPPTDRPVIIGEEGPEIFVADTAGTIIPNKSAAVRRLLDESRPDNRRGLAGALRTVTKFAHGGRPPVDQEVIVGEKGPEIFVPDPTERGEGDKGPIGATETQEATGFEGRAPTGGATTPAEDAIGKTLGVVAPVVGRMFALAQNLRARFSNVVEVEENEITLRQAQLDATVLGAGSKFGGGKQPGRGPDTRGVADVGRAPGRGPDTRGGLGDTGPGGDAGGGGGSGGAGPGAGPGSSGGAGDSGEGTGAGPGAGPGSEGAGFEHGGRPDVGQAVLVGERGPEHFVPDVPGKIIPNSEIGGGPQTTNVFNIDARGAAPGVDRDVRRALGELRGEMPRIAVNSVVDARRRNPNLFR